MKTKYIKLFENFEDTEDKKFDPREPEGTKQWMSSVSEINEKVEELRNNMDMLKEAEKQIKELERSLKLSELKDDQKRLLEDIKIGMSSINKSTHKAFGLVLKYRKNYLRWDPPSKTLMLDIIALSLEGGKEFIERLKTESEFKNPVPVEATIKAEYDKEEITEAEEMMIKKPWYKRAWDKLTNWLSSFRRKVIDVSVELDSLVNKFEQSLKETEMKPQFSEKGGEELDGFYI